MATIHDVARHAGVSPVTVSRVLNRSARVSPATEERVRRAMAELGYVPSSAARSLRLRQTRTLALLVPDITNPFWTTVARGVEDAAQSCGYSVFLGNTDENPSKQRDYLMALVGQRVDGVIVAPYDSNPDGLALLQQKRIPTVLIDRRVEGWHADTVIGDSLAGACALVTHLIALGHRRIAMISGPASTTTATDRVAGYCLALQQAGLPLAPELVCFGEYRPASGERLTAAVLGLDPRPTAIFAANNLIAIGVIAAVGRAGLRIPEDVAVVAFDDLPDAARVFPFLTVAVQPAYEMGATAARLLLNRLESGPGHQPQHVVFPTRLVIRRSCGSVPPAAAAGRPLPSLPLSIPGQSRPAPALPPAAVQQAYRLLQTVLADKALIPDGPPEDAKQPLRLDERV
jgi:LacI family transcriptional regulator